MPSRSPSRDAETFQPAEIEAIAVLRGPLLRWYRRSRRDLPWRRIRDPYAIWISEIMLQQTRVSVVVPYYRRFLARFPDVESLAGATDDEIHALWSGLGYYRRAHALPRAAREMVRLHGGRVPRDPEALRRLPGIGRYTAGAIASIAFDADEPVLDGNVRRVLCRVLGLRGDEPGAGPGGERLWRLATRLAAGPAPGDRNQALMELGAVVCTPKRPACARCPARAVCRARATGTPETFPAVAPRRTPETVRVGVAVVFRGGRVLLERGGGSSPLRGRWDLPARELADAGAGADRLAELLGAEHRVAMALDRRAGRLSHAILHRRLELELFRGRLDRGRVAGHPRLRWVDLDELDQAPVSGATRKVLAAVAADSGAQTPSQPGGSSESRSGSFAPSRAIPRRNA